MKILAVDDEDSIRELLELQLKRNGYETLTAADGQAALEQAAQADLVLLDVMLPGIDGFEVCRRLKADPSTQAIPVIMLTAKSEEIDKVLGLELGADDYMVKPFSVREFLTRVRVLLRRTSKTTKVVEEHPVEEIRVGDLIMNYSQRTCLVAGKPVNLGYKEFEILWFLASNPDKVFRRDDIMSKVWGIEGIPLDTKTVDVHIRWIRKKIEPEPENPKYIETVRGVGYKFSTHKASEN